MNLSVKRLGQLAMLAVALFFFSCEDLSSIGIPNPTPKFDIRYAELTLPSSVIRMDTLRPLTTLFPYNSQVTPKSPYDVGGLLVGQYQDSVFGEVQARSFTSLYPSQVFELTGNPVYNDTVMLDLTFDLYTYGTSGSSQQSIEIYRLSNPIGSTWRKNTRTSIPYDTLLGGTSFTIDPTVFAKDTTITISIPLAKEFGKTIFNQIITYKTGATKSEDSVNFLAFDKAFREAIPGIAIVPTSGDKIYRFSPASSGVRVYYGTDTNHYTQYLLAVNNYLGGVNQITSSGGDVAMVNSQSDFLKDDPNRYIQSGTGIFTKVDLSPLYNFIDTVPKALINSAHFVISGVKSSQFAPPAALGMRLLDENNREVFFDSTSNYVDIAKYGIYLGLDGGSSKPFIVSTIVAQPDKALFFADDIGRAEVLVYKADSETQEKSYSGYVTMIAQRLLKYRNGREKYNNVLLYPVLPKASKTVNRAVFPAANIKLKLYYTIPTNVAQ